MGMWGQLEQRVTGGNRRSVKCGSEADPGKACVSSVFKEEGYCMPEAGFHRNRHGGKLEAMSSMHSLHSPSCRADPNYIVQNNSQR